jgi:hypothetical protein
MTQVQINYAKRQIRWTFLSSRTTTSCTCLSAMLIFFRRANYIRENLRAWSFVSLNWNVLLLFLYGVSVQLCMQLHILVDLGMPLVSKILLSCSTSYHSRGLCSFVWESFVLGTTVFILGSQYMSYFWTWFSILVAAVTTKLLDNFME